VVVDPITGQGLEYRHLLINPDAETWIHSFANNLGRLAQGVGTHMTSGNNTIFFIPRSAVPKETHGLIWTSYFHHSTSKGRDTQRLPHYWRRPVKLCGDASSACVAIATVKLIPNIVISTPNGRFGTLDLKYFYYGTPLSEYEYM